MAEPKTRPTDASVEAFLDAVTPAVRREDGFVLLELMKDVTGQEPVMWGPSIVGFGSRPMTYASGKTTDWPVLAFSPRKTSTTVYLMDDLDRYADLFAVLGKHTASKACLYIPRLAAVDQDVLRQVLQRAWEN